MDKHLTVHIMLIILMSVKLPGSLDTPQLLTPNDIPSVFAWVVQVHFGSTYAEEGGGKHLKFGK